MPITSGDIVWYPGTRLSEAADAGGPPRYWPLPDAVVNNIFDDVFGIHKDTGFLSCRKAYPGLINGDTAGLLDAKMFMLELPTHPDTDALLFMYGSRNTVRTSTAPVWAAVSSVSRTAQYGRIPGDPDFQVITAGLPKGRVTLVNGTTALQIGNALMFVSGVSVGGTVQSVGQITGTAYISDIISTGTYYGVATTTVEYEIIWESPYGPIRTDSIAVRVEPTIHNGTATQCVSVATLTAAAGSGATELEVNRVTAQFVPYDPTNPFQDYPTDAAAVGVEPDLLRPWNGRVPIFHRNQQVYITDGTTGELRTVSRVGFDGKIYLASALSGSYSSGAMVCGTVFVSEIVAGATTPFSQRTWTRIFAAAVVGPAISPLYDHAAEPIETNSLGTIEQEWAVVFGTTPGEFSLVGNTVGTTATGDTGTDLAPINPSTGTPFFTLRAAGWIGSPVVGNCLRFGTRAAISPTPCWFVRVRNKGASFSTPPVSMTAALRLTDGTIGTVELPWMDDTTENTAGAGAGTPPPAPPSVDDEGIETPVLSPGGTIPALSTYRMAHTLLVTDEADDAVLPVERVSIGIDDGSIGWTLNAQGRPELYDLFAESVTPKQVRVSIDGIEWVFVVEGVTRSRTGPVEQQVTFTGRSIAVMAGEPYSLSRNWFNDGATTAAQMCIFAQETGATGVDVQWYARDWLVPDKVWTYAGTPLGVVQRVAESVGAQVISDRAEKRLYVVPRYIRMPAEWASATPDVTIAIEAAKSDNFERADKPRYTSVYVSGQQQGVIGQVILAGTDGADQAPLVTDLLITEAPAVLQRGKAILGAGGRQARVRMVLPVLTGAGRPGVLSPGQLVAVGTWRGIVRAVSVTAAIPEVEQTVVIERHLS